MTSTPRPAPVPAADRSVLARARRKLRERGLLATLGAVGSRTGLKLLMAWRRLARHRQIVFVREAGAQEGPGTPGLVVQPFERVEDLPAPVAGELKSLRSPTYLDTVRTEITRGAILWVGLLDDHVAGTSLSRAGRHFPRWYLPLQPDDVVIFSNITEVAHRGKGVCPTIMRRVCAAQLTPGAKAYVDCRVWNQASIRSIERAGFRRLTVCKPLTAREVFG